MTGVVTSNRCGTCRKRKVKCDEAKPVCGPCRKGNRECEEPISKLKFTRPKEIPINLVFRPPADKPRPVLDPCSHVAVVKLSSTEDGGSFSTLRVARTRRKAIQRHQQDGDCWPLAMAQDPPLSPTESLQLILIESFGSTQPGLSLACAVECISSIPRRLGHSTPLDDAVTCLIERRSCLARKEYMPSQFQSKLYVRAIRSLRAAIADPVEGYSDNTLCAVILLGQVEVLGGGNSEGHNYVAHAGGASKLIQLRGPSRHQSCFSRLLLADQRGATASLPGLYYELCNQRRGLLLEFTVLVGNPVFGPALLKLRQENQSPGSRNRADLLREAQKLRRALQMPSEFVIAAFENGVDVIEVPSIRGDRLVPVVYEYSSRALANACVMYWASLLMLDTIIAQLLPLTSPQTTIQALRNQCDCARQKILMSYEYAERFKPLGSMFIAWPLIMSWKDASPDEREWIFSGLATLGEHCYATRRGWSEIGLVYSTKYFFG
ncbi:uncharacterized protein BDR25DRAFT_340991 [Lindgomyces ingoldianus]|uniref:Uncharacterized protein n=1 Tax=Lindgomyces ingoldianus TaxID=673940 RepID=A0ACB6R3I8_9PLEO|nr:uncharacterized protein BDR25DRAFT_340991 [Lindgomyces ingoldianus]KAF2473670.1 hypothetical protein BDR25DRAFT_340991 [Lindgomyces ingoldianus]